MRKKTRRRWAYGLGLLLNCIGIVVNAQCNGTAERIHPKEPTSGLISSPNYPTAYAPDLRCDYELKARRTAGLVVQVDVLEMDLRGPYSASNQCLRDYLVFVVIDRSGREHLSERFCGHPAEMPVFHTLQSQIRIVFVSGMAAPGKRRGFKLRYSFVPEGKLEEERVDIRAPPSLYFDPNTRLRKECGGSTNANEISGEIKSPGYPRTYPKNVTCNWLIRVAEGKRIYLRLLHLQLSTTVAECDRSSLHFIDGFKHESAASDLPPYLSDDVRYCGSHLYYNEEGMKSYLSNGNRVIIRFITTDHPSAEQLQLQKERGLAIGFKILWTEVNSLVATEESREDDVPCRGFTCRGGEFCIDDGQNICASRTRLCLNSSLQCNGISNCAENDASDEEFCYSDGVLTYVGAGAVSVVIFTALLCVFCRLFACFASKRRTQRRFEDQVYDDRSLRPLPFATRVEAVRQEPNGTRARRATTDAASTVSFSELTPVWQQQAGSPNRVERRDSSAVRFQRLQRAQV